MINQAIVLAAGFGERLRPLTLNCPKPLLEVKGKPLLVHNLIALEQAGIKNIVIHVSYLAQNIIRSMNEIAKWHLDLNLSFAESKQPLGTGGGICLAKNYLADPSAPFICVNSDIYTNYDYQEICHLKLDTTNNIGHLVLVPNPQENLKGDYDFIPLQSDKGPLIKHPNDNKYTFSGIAAYHPELVGCTRQNAESHHAVNYSIVEDINANMNKFTASLHSGFWHDIGTIERLQSIQTQRVE